jgi:hypothetical protein
MLVAIALDINGIRLCLSSRFAVANLETRASDFSPRGSFSSYAASGDLQWLPFKQGQVLVAAI